MHPLAAAGAVHRSEAVAAVHPSAAAGAVRSQVAVAVEAVRSQEAAMVVLTAEAMAEAT